MGEQHVHETGDTLYARTDEYLPVQGYPDRPATIPENLWKQFWDRRRDTQRYLDQRQKERTRLQKIRDQVSANRRRFVTLLPPVVTLESMYPNGVIVHWAKPEGWDPDGYRILVRDLGSGGDGWRSVTTQKITRDTRKVALPTRYLRWGQDADAYEIKVEAEWRGVGNIAACPQVYPPQAAPPPKRPPTRMERIVEACRTFKGRRLKRGKGAPYLRDLRRHAEIPNITSRERHEAHRRA